MDNNHYAQGNTKSELLRVKNSHLSFSKPTHMCHLVGLDKAIAAISLVVGFISS